MVDDAFGEIVFRDFEGVDDVVGGFDGGEKIAGNLADGAHDVEVLEELEEVIPRAVGIEDDHGLAFELGIERLVADEGGAGFEEVLEARSGGEDEGVAPFDGGFDIAEGNDFVAITIDDIEPGFVEGI